MSEHSTPQPAHPGGNPNVPPIDVVAGDPPVPITVWRTARSGDDQNTTITRRLAYRLVAAYSRPGDAVVDLTDTHALTTACRRGGRPHLPARFTGPARLTVGPPTPPPAPPSDHRPDPGGPDLDGSGEEGVWFGDDLTDPAPLPGDDPTTPPGDDNPQPRTSLVVATWPLHTRDDTANLARLGGLLTACGRLLRPGGCLVLVAGAPAGVTAAPAGVTAAPQDFTPVVDAATSAGLGYLQHIVAVAADTDGDRFTYHATDEELLSLARATAGQEFVLHVKVHADLLVFTTQRGGERRA
ncbi:hypothetical protein [Solwaraspora sp. WMMA2065]|uniref:hypothetical protein n=1 Tax=Solwaraspora sp. WMMA2065 TaxID=3015166 RepID=UPI00259BCA6A|nr:hypothetical protein [Solwaraspora sp. WMMA2065]WJK33127.1 hypothetical protein O7610_20735 [Solwaraspora sp. WMMA2065]